MISPDNGTSHASLELKTPDVFGFAGHLAQQTGRKLLIEVNERGAWAPPAWVRRVVGCESHLRLSGDELISSVNDPHFGSDAIVVYASSGCPTAGVLPVEALRALAERETLVLLTAPLGSRPADALTWLRGQDLPVVFSGLTVSDNFLRLRTNALFVLDRRLFVALRNPASLARSPLAIVSVYNDGDILEQLSARHLAEGLDLHFIDNWSEDRTGEIMARLAALEPGRVSFERYPAEGPSNEYRWAAILDRKAEIAAQHPGRWVLHVDSDELRLSPWEGLTTAQGFAVAEAFGADLVNFSVLNFSPTRDGFQAGDNPLTFFTQFSFPDSPPHFNQHRAWRQGSTTPVDLSSSGGHRAKFPGSRMFPYNFPLLHYSIRSTRQGTRKVYVDRKPRLSHHERVERGWHYHYASVEAGARFIQLEDNLERFEAANFRRTYTAELLSDANRRRLAGSLMLRGEEEEA